MKLLSHKYFMNSRNENWVRLSEKIDFANECPVYPAILAILMMSSLQYIVCKHDLIRFLSLQPKLPDFCVPSGQCHFAFAKCCSVNGDTLAVRTTPMDTTLLFGNIALPREHVESLYTNGPCQNHMNLNDPMFRGHYCDSIAI